MSYLTFSFTVFPTVHSETISCCWRMYFFLGVMVQLRYILITWGKVICSHFLGSLAMRVSMSLHLSYQSMYCIRFFRIIYKDIKLWELENIRWKLNKGIEATLSTVQAIFLRNIKTRIILKGKVNASRLMHQLPITIITVNKSNIDPL